MMRGLRAAVVAISLVAGFEACGSGSGDGATHGDGADAAPTDDAGGHGPVDATLDGTGTGLPGDAGTGDTGAADAALEACVGLGCDFASCADGGTTTLSGTVYAPSGTLPLYGVSVYVPGSPPSPMKHGVGATCEPCATAPAGNPVSQTTTNEAGVFHLSVPVAANLPVVIEIGKWRKQLVLKTAATACADATLPVVDTTLPRSATDIAGDTTSVDMPQIAVSTGVADALECLVRKLGIADSEFTSIGAGGPAEGHVHLFANVSSGGVGTNKFTAGFAGGSGNFADSQTQLWADGGTLSPYDLIMLSCEGAQSPDTKPQAAMDALKQYADLGGRVFMSHWHNIWIEGSTLGGGTQAPAVWTGIASWSNGGATLPSSTNVTIDEHDGGEGAALAGWLLANAGSTTRDLVPLQDGTGRSTCSNVDEAKATRVAFLQGADGGANGVQIFQFTTPAEIAPASRCGEVAFSDMHVSGDSSSGADKAFPTGCASGSLTAQEKALAFVFFNLSRCGR